MVAIVDPHVKRTDDYRIYTDARDLDVLVKRADGSNFEGWCWPGSSVWVDFFNPKSWDWWTRMFKMDTWKVGATPAVGNADQPDTDLQDSAPNLYIWNDMNEVSLPTATQSNHSVTILTVVAIGLRWSRDHCTKGHDSSRRMGEP